MRFFAILLFLVGLPVFASNVQLENLVALKTGRSYIFPYVSYAAYGTVLGEKFKGKISENCRQRIFSLDSELTKLYCDPYDKPCEKSAHCHKKKGVSGRVRFGGSRIL